MYPILVVEDSDVVMKVIHHILRKSTLIQPTYASSFAQSKTAIKNSQTPFFAALVDLTLPDAPNGEVVNYTLKLGIPTLVLTGSFDDKHREILLEKGIVDYIIKEGRFSYDYALDVIHRLIKNQSIKVMVVDDSPTSRQYISHLLKLHLYQVYEANDGVMAIQLLLKNPDIQLIITDYRMPRMDGFELTKNIRIKFNKSELIIIGLSSHNSGNLTARFIKHGANDFLNKSFNHEEFYCRISQNIEYLELIDQIKDSAARDELTGLYNQAYFIKKGGVLFQSAALNKTALACAVIEIDDLQKINDHYGLEECKHVIKVIAKRLAPLFSRFLVSLGTDNNYFILLSGLDNDKACAFVQHARQIVSQEPVTLTDRSINVTLSGGVSNMMGETLNDSLEAALRCLDRAKNAGSDLVFGDDLYEE